MTPEGSDGILALFDSMMVYNNVAIDPGGGGDLLADGGSITETT